MAGSGEHVNAAWRKLAMQREDIALESDEDGVTFNIKAQSDAFFMKLFVPISHQRMAGMVEQWFEGRPLEFQQALLESLQKLLRKE